MDEKFLEMAGQLSADEVTAGLQTARIRKPKPEGFDGTCECGEKIPSERVELGFYNCVPCQESSEVWCRRWRSVGPRR